MEHKPTLCGGPGSSGVMIDNQGILHFPKTPMPEYIWADDKGNYVPEIGSMSVGNHRRYKLCE